MLAERYDAVLVDLDGVVYRGDQAIPAAVAALSELRRRGIKVLFLTNNSSRTPAQVAEKLQGLGVEAGPADVLTSAVATAGLLRREGTSHGSAFVIGEQGIREALQEVGVELMDGEPEAVDVVVVGWDRGVNYDKLRTASLLVERGARLIATNADASYPAPDGLWPGAGAILAAVTTTTGAVPSVVGKPARPMFEAAAEITGATRPLVVGDRLDTDVAGAASMGWDSLLVLSGATRPADLLRSDVLPTVVASDLSGLLQDLPAARLRGAGSKDLPELRQLLETSGLRSDGLAERLRQTMVAVSSDGEGSVLATASVQDVGPGAAEGRPGSSGRYGVLRSVAVAPGLRGKGLGHLVSAGAAGSGRGRGITHLYLFTETAQPFFERLGFTTVERQDVPSTVLQTAHAAEECPAAVAMTLPLERPVNSPATAR